jgi:hypothetical protein
MLFGGNFELMGHIISVLFNCGVPLSYHIQDRYAVAQSLPPIDPQQDWNLVRGENENGFTTLEFWRKWVTCDDRDRDIEVSGDCTKSGFCLNNMPHASSLLVPASFPYVF